jgi:DNA processing protein
MLPDELKYYIAVELIPGVGSILAKRLIAYCGSAEAIFLSKPSALQKIPGIGHFLTREIISQQVVKRAEKELSFLEKNNIQAYCYTDPDYPERLRHCEDAPVVLFVKGNLDLNRSKFLSVVGTRHATAYGRSVCERIISQLAERGHNPVIVSGLAYGIDVCAHKAALQNSLDTVAVMATGLNKIYPFTHTSVARQIIGQGALVSDFTSDAEIDRTNFLKRNRIIAGLSDATLIIESKVKGGALVTADIAASYNRDVMAIPGRIGDISSEGCNALIRHNKAALIETAEDVEYVTGWTRLKSSKPVKQLSLFDLSQEEELVISLLKPETSESIDTLCYQTNIPMSRLSSLLLSLELKDIVKSLPGKQYALKV